MFWGVWFDFLLRPLPFGHCFVCGRLLKYSLSSHPAAPCLNWTSGRASAFQASSHGWAVSTTGWKNQVSFLATWTNSFGALSEHLQGKLEGSHDAILHNFLALAFARAGKPMDYFFFGRPSRQCKVAAWPDQNPEAEDAPTSAEKPGEVREEVGAKTEADHKAPCWRMVEGFRHFCFAFMSKSHVSPETNLLVSGRLHTFGIILGEVLAHIGTHHDPLLFFIVCSFCFCLFLSFSLMFRSKSGVTGGPDLALSAAYTPEFARAVYAAWFRTWAVNRPWNPMKAEDAKQPHASVWSSLTGFVSLAPSVCFSHMFLHVSRWDGPKRHAGMPWTVQNAQSYIYTRIYVCFHEKSYEKLTQFHTTFTYPYCLLLCLGMKVLFTTHSCCLITYRAWPGGYIKCYGHWWALSCLICVLEFSLIVQKIAEAFMSFV